MKFIFACSLALLFTVNSSLAQNQKKMPEIDKTTVDELELEKYLGKWYEIARFPHSFEKDLQGVTATYSIRSDGKIKVLNQGYKGTLQGEKSTAIGKAKLNKKGGPAKLKVSFFWFFYGDYWVMELDPDYQWALVGSKSDKFLWILSRTPQMNKKDYNYLINRAKERGYNLETLQKVQHK